MKLVDLTVKGFTDELASGSPAPGGGSTAALEGSFGAGLIAMVCELTLGSKKCEAYHEKAEAVRAEAAECKERFLELIDEDTEAFNLVSAAFAMKKDTDEEKALRSRAIQEGLKKCCLPPLKVMADSLRCLKLAKQLIDGFNVNTASDLGTGIASLKAAGHGAYLNVLINVQSIKDEDYGNARKSEAEKLFRQICEESDRLSEKVLSLLG